MKRTLLPVIGLAMHIATPVCAVPACLPNEVYNADAALRYQALLRTTALACGNFAAGEPIQNYYQVFRENNEKLLSADQAVLDRYYNEGDDASHLRETEMQNAQATALAHKGTARFCQTAVPALKEAVLDSPREVQASIADFAFHNPGAAKRCN